MFHVSRHGVFLFSKNADEERARQEYILYLVDEKFLLSLLLVTTNRNLHSVARYRLTYYHYPNFHCSTTT